MPEQTESRIQSDIVRWYNNTFCLTHHSPRGLIISIPNGGLRSEITANRSKAIGEYAGASDLIVIHKGQVMFIEVKREKGVQSPKQKLFQQHVIATGHPYHIIRSLDDFKKLIK